MDETKPVVVDLTQESDEEMRQNHTTHQTTINHSHSQGNVYLCVVATTKVCIIIIF